MKQRARIAIAGAGIYGATAAIWLARRGHAVTLFDPLGLLNAASAINQFRVHRGYHYPRSPETIAEVLESRQAFIAEYQTAIVSGKAHYYAIPREGSLVSCAEYEAAMARFDLPLEESRPGWMDFDFIERCYRVEESFYDPSILRELLRVRLRDLGVECRRERFGPELEGKYDACIYATYANAHGEAGIFGQMRRQVAEKVLIEVPAPLRDISLVIVDGAFTAFDHYPGRSEAQFGSARFSNRWTTLDPGEPVPAAYADLINCGGFRPVACTNFTAMREDAMRAVPAIEEARYLGSRFTCRMVEHDPGTDRRVLRIAESPDGRVFHVFSGKVVGAVKAAEQLAGRIASRVP
ncbi:FAD-dependent oxidoreductase [Ferruginivarius sediminum]|uniref:FAD-binding oxidoreductase n=1 Tax=Ferruginivarius sediminum TaxID=2661937 RepID=A0A369TCX0_9PROT|nr:FAD-dependent oxidoreductase [Ferruginivarius sediminum]RDD63159.1 FAD-binding oxidoreductase [Ferruginivarius sediminum]